jgi:hypothetical protein
MEPLLTFRTDLNFPWSFVSLISDWTRWFVNFVGSKFLNCLYFFLGFKRTLYGEQAVDIVLTSFSCRERHEENRVDCFLSLICMHICSFFRFFVWLKFPDLGRHSWSSDYNMSTDCILFFKKKGLPWPLHQSMRTAS